MILKQRLLLLLTGILALNCTGCAEGSRDLPPDQYITITVEGPVFAPALELHTPAKITLDYGDESAFAEYSVPVGPFLPESRIFAGNATVHTVRLLVSPWSALKTLNLGFRGGDDGNLNLERNDIDFIPLHPDDEAYPTDELTNAERELRIRELVGTVTGVSNLSAAVNLEALCCEWQKLETLDLSGCTKLRTLEAYYSRIKTVGFADCVELRRSCLEATGARYNLRYGVQSTEEMLDLGDSPQLRDIRGTGNDHTRVRLHPEALDTLWHFCKMDNPHLTELQIGTEAPAPFEIDRFTALREFWLMGSPVAETIVLTNGITNSVLVSSGAVRHFSAVNQVQLYDLRLNNNDIETLNIDGCSSLNLLYLQNCALSQAQVDYVLATLDNFNTEEGEVFLGSNPTEALPPNANAAPSATGLAHAASLSLRGWNVTLNE